jgi:hypothetical protein
MVDRIMRAIRLDPTLYREVADNPAYTQEAIIIAVVVTIISALYTLIFVGFTTFLVEVLSGLLLGWILWALVAYFVGQKFFKGRSAPMEMIRTLAYAGIPRIFFIIPCFGWIIAVILIAVAGVIAIRESMEFDTRSAIITAVVGLLVFIVASSLISYNIGGAADLLGGPF